MSLALLKSRKFWAMVAAIITGATGLAMNEITFWQFAQLAAASLLGWAATVAVEDHGEKSGSQISVTTETVSDAEKPAA